MDSDAGNCSLLQRLKLGCRATLTSVPLQQYMSKEPISENTHLSLTSLLGTDQGCGLSCRIICRALSDFQLLKGWEQAMFLLRYRCLVIVSGVSPRPLLRARNYSEL
jgi:hypothetical protein